MKIKQMKTLMAGVFALAAAVVCAADAMPRSEWHAIVGDCAQSPQTLRGTMAKVAPADQTALLGEVNEAIAKMPGSDEVKGARFYAANSAAVKSAAKGNLANVLAEVFATVPPEYLTDINERFAAEVFSRTANPNRTFSDAEYVELAKTTMGTINARCEKAEYPGVRETFAILMFLRASGGTPADLSATLVATMPNEKNRELATNEWIKPAMGDGQEQTYDPLLGAAQAGEEPDHAIVTSLTGAPDMLVAMLGYLADERSKMSVKTEKMGGGAFLYPTRSGTAANSQADIGLNRIPRGAIEADDSPYHTVKRGKRAGEVDDGGSEPRPYDRQ